VAFASPRGGVASRSCGNEAAKCDNLGYRLCCLVKSVRFVAKVAVGPVTGKSKTNHEARLARTGAQRHLKGTADSASGNGPPEIPQSTEQHGAAGPRSSPGTSAGRPGCTSGEQQRSQLALGPSPGGRTKACRAARPSSPGCCGLILPLQVMTGAGVFKKRFIREEEYDGKGACEAESSSVQRRPRC